jgi:two-component system, OmpR family, response regulator
VASHRARILVVDDEARVCELLREYLTIQGYDVATAATGAAALDAVPIFQPDVILVDMRMPSLSGRDVLDTVRRRGLTMPVVLMSGDSARAGEGFFDVLQKPFDLSKIAQVVAAALAHVRTSDG